MEKEKAHSNVVVESFVCWRPLGCTEQFHHAVTRAVNDHCTEGIMPQFTDVQDTVYIESNCATEDELTEDSEMESVSESDDALVVDESRDGSSGQRPVQRRRVV